MQTDTNTALYSDAETEREMLIREIRESFNKLPQEEKLRYLSQLREMLETEKAAD